MEKKKKTTAARIGCLLSVSASSSFGTDPVNALSQTRETSPSRCPQARRNIGCTVVAAVLVTHSRLTLWDLLDCSPPGSSVQGILQARILEWVAIPFSRGSSQSRNWTCVSCTAGKFFSPSEPPGKPQWLHDPLFCFHPEGGARASSMPCYIRKGHKQVQQTCIFLSLLLEFLLDCTVVWVP